MQRLVAVAVFVRGSGLGNRLFQWARAKVWCYEHRAQLISPIWIRCSLGHLWRRTVPLSQYAGRIALIGLFRRHPEDLPAYLVPLLRLRHRMIRESQHSPVVREGRGAIYYLDSRQDSFERLNPYQERLRSDFLAMVAPSHRRRVEAMEIPPIGINLRIGKDFAPPPAVSENDARAYEWVGWLQQTPISWFSETLLAVRAAAGWCVPALVVSDGTAEQLKPLLELPAVQWLSSSNAAIDLLALSMTKLLLGSGSSTFSAWAAFLGQQSVITAPGHPFTNLKLQPLQGQTIAAFDPRNPDHHILTRITFAACAGCELVPAALSTAEIADRAPADPCMH